MARVTERFLARVVANDDENHRGRIKVICPDLTGDPDTVLPNWIEGAFDWGWFVIPDVDEVVEIEVVTSTEMDETVGQSTIYNPEIRWRQKREYHAGEDEGGVATGTPIHEDFTSSNYGKRRGFATPNGHILLFDDTEAGERINLTWHALEGEEDKYSYISFDPTGSILLGNKNGSLIHLDAANGSLTIIDENGNLYSSDSKGLKLVDKNGNVIELKGGAVQVLAPGSVVINCKTAQMKAGAVELGDGADTPVVRGDDWKTWAENHTHPTGVGPSGIPIQPILPAVLSSVATVK